MAILTLDLFESLAIVQGYDWQVSVLLAGDQRGSQLVGKIFNRYDGLELLGFGSNQGQFLTDINKTRFRLTIPRQQTSTLPLTGSNFWVWNLRQNRFNIPPRLLVAGKVRVNPSLP